MSSESVIQEVHPPIEEYWQPSMPPDDLIFDDGEPLETNRHRIAMNLLIRSINHAWKDRNDYFAGGNMFIYYSRSQAKNRDFRGPDFFTVLDIDGSYDRQGWVVWDEGGHYPDVIIELLSESTAAIDKGAKKTLYERVFRTFNYFVFDPFDANSLEGWELNNRGRYQPLAPNAQGHLWSESLGLWLGTWQAEYQRVTADWLRFYNDQSNLVLLPEEAERQRADEAVEQVEQERQENERLRARLRAAGIDPDEL
jgi:Uma2 family endonuclease